MAKSKRSRATTGKSMISTVELGNKDDERRWERDEVAASCDQNGGESPSSSIAAAQPQRGLRVA